jgi:hypothetical protein
VALAIPAIWQLRRRYRSTHTSRGIDITCFIVLALSVFFAFFPTPGVEWSVLFESKIIQTASMVAAIPCGYCIGNTIAWIARRDRSPEAKA